VTDFLQIRLRLAFVDLNLWKSQDNQGDTPMLLLLGLMGVKFMDQVMQLLVHSEPSQGVN
jgi:hypothetical protein